MHQSVGTLYDALAKFEAWFGSNSKETSYSIHKRLHFQLFDETKDFTDINEWILAKLPITHTGKILDAGCGVGNTLLYFCQQSQMQGLGVSLSGNEIAKANAAVKKLDLSNRCSFKQQSFDQSFNEKFDTIIAIESLKHAPNLELALKNLANSLNEEGYIIIVEDFGNSDWDSNSELQKTFLKNWSVQKFYSVDDYKDTLAPELNATDYQLIDFTKFMEEKPADKMLSRYRLLQKIRPFLVFPFLKSIVATFAGGFLLDYFYAKGWVKYQLLFLQKKKA